MDFADYVVVGSGPAGVAAASRLEQRGTVMLDIGDEPQAPFGHATLRDALDNASQADLLGPGFELLEEIDDPRKRHVKLRAPGLRYVANGQDYSVVGADGRIASRGRTSTAAGGLANAWGAQLLRYTQQDLDECGDWPINARELDPYYDWLEDHIGLSGADDDLSGFLGAQHLAQAPVRPAALGQNVLDRYARARHKVQSAGMSLGLPRLAVLTAPHRGRPAHGFGQTEFFTTDNPGIYTPVQTLREIRARGLVDYRQGHRLVSYEEKPDHVELQVQDVRAGQSYSLRARHLLLGCGVLQTSRLVLEAAGRTAQPLPFLDQPPLLIPLFFPRHFGRKPSVHGFPVQFIGTLQSTAGRDMLTFYDPRGVLRSELVGDVPLPVPAGLKALDMMLGGMLVAQIWQRAAPAPGKSMRIVEDGSLEIRHPDAGPYAGQAGFLQAMRALGGYTLSRWVNRAPAGWGFHYAGSLPMRQAPGEFQTHTDGRLWSSQRVRAIDGSVLPSLPAKNHSLTIMANAARIAESTRACGY